MQTAEARVATTTLDDALLRLAREPDRWTPLRLWKVLDPEHRTRAVRDGLAERPASLRKYLIEGVARTHHFRTQTVHKWSDDKLAGHAARLDIPSVQVVLDLLALFHLRERGDLVVDFLDRLEIPHREGALDESAEEPLTRAASDHERVFRVADELAERHPLGQVVVYFLTMGLQDVPIRSVLERWLRDRFADEPEPGTEEAAEEIETAASAEEPEDTDQFTTLDRHLVRAIVDTAQGIEGSLSEDELDDLIEEMIQLNSSRHRTYFHAGFADVVLGREPRDGLPAQNRERLRWYWAGYVTGLARTERWTEIVRHYDEAGGVRELGETGIGPSDAAARIVFRALCREGRESEAVTFLRTRAVVRKPALMTDLHDEGSRLLRNDRAAEARGFFDLLGKAVDRMEKRGEDTTTRPFLEVRRRRAHCFRQLGEMARAEELLLRLLEEESDPELRSMVLTDLGLIDAGLRSLAEIRLPDDDERQGILRDALEKGRPRFEESAATGRKYPAHGHYGLGVLALLERRYGEAVGHLDHALSVFESEPRRYGPGGILATARLSLGLALCLDLQTSRLPRAAELIAAAVEEGLNVPDSLVVDTLGALDLNSDRLARATAETILEAAGPAVLDRLVESEAVPESATLADALLQRARNEKRGVDERRRDYARLLPMLRAQNRTAEAAEAIDFLEFAALEGLGVEWFVELLESPARYEPAWDPEDALGSRVQVLESAGEYERADAVLEEAFHRILSSEAFGAVDDAGAVLERIEEHGTGPERVRALRSRLEAARAKRAPDEEEDTAEPAPPRRVRVLFVGGNEIQERYDQRIKEDLKQTHPHIHVTFFHPGWTSNWGPQLEHVKGLLPRQDAVVIMRFIRTEFGRSLRKELEVPWRGCHGSGRDAIKRGIVLAAGMGGEDT